MHSSLGNKSETPSQKKKEKRKKKMLLNEPNSRFKIAEEKFINLEIDHNNN